MLKIRCDIPLLGFCAYSGTGKTTLLAQVMPMLKARGVRLGLIKHAHHNFEIDQPGKDSYQLRKAGADQVLIASRQRMALIKEYASPHQEPHLAELLPCMDTRELDLILVEGFKREPIPKIELYRAALQHPLIHARDRNVIAIAADTPIAVARDIPRLDLNRPREVLGFVVDWLQLASSTVSHSRCSGGDGGH